MTAICSLCKKEVLPGQGTYSITGDHWDCHHKQVVGIMGYYPGSTREFNARANGGWNTHRVRGNTSLCGHEPKNRGYMLRARWIEVKGDVTCRHCLAKLGTAANRGIDDTEKR